MCILISLVSQIMFRSFAKETLSIIQADEIDYDRLTQLNARSQSRTPIMTALAVIHSLFLLLAFADIIYFIVVSFQITRFTDTILRYDVLTHEKITE